MLIVVLRAFFTVPAKGCRWKLHSLSSTGSVLCFYPSLLESVGIVLVVLCVVTGSVTTSVLSCHEEAGSSPQPCDRELWQCSWKNKKKWIFLELSLMKLLNFQLVNVRADNDKSSIARGYHCFTNTAVIFHPSVPVRSQRVKAHPSTPISH